MKTLVHETANGGRFTECLDEIENAMDLVATCLGEQPPLLLVDAVRLPARFFDLRSGFAGELVQKLENYRVTTALVITPDSAHGDRFREFVAEARRGRHFRVFADRTEAEAWLASRYE